MKKYALAFILGAGLGAGATVAPQLAAQDLTVVSAPGGVLASKESACLDGIIKSRVERFEAGKSISCEMQSVNGSDLAWVCPTLEAVVRK
jgi:hypothetical protein